MKIIKGVISEQYSYFVSTSIRFIKDVLRGQMRLNPNGLITLNTMWVMQLNGAVK